MDVATDCCQ